MDTIEMVSWRDDLAELELRYHQAGMSRDVGWGQRPLLVIVDFSLGFTDPASPLGGDVSVPIAAAGRLVAAARAARVPVVFTTVAYRADMSDAGVWPDKLPSQHHLIEGTRWADIDPRLDCRPDEVVVKKHASAFLGTDLAATAHADGIDTVVVAGCTTSGCVRATVVDACGHGFRTIVAADAVSDRHPLVHEVSLFDMRSKYADVLSTDAIVEHLQAAVGQ